MGHQIPLFVQGQFHGQVEFRGLRKGHREPESLRVLQQHVRVVPHQGSHLDHLVGGADRRVAGVGHRVTVLCQALFEHQGQGGQVPFPCSFVQSAVPDQALYALHKGLLIDLGAHLLGQELVEAVGLPFV